MERPPPRDGPRPREGLPAVIGVDLGATKLAAAWVGPDGRRAGARSTRVHDNPPPAQMIDEILRLVEDARATKEFPPRAVGVGIAAQVHEDDGTVAYAPNLGWSAIPLGRVLGEGLGVPVAVLNDARAATLAVWRHGRLSIEGDVLVILVGTGVGGSLVSGGRLLTGSSGAFGEVGHSVLIAGGRKCHCPGRGCLEAYVGGWAIAERALEAVTRSPERGGSLRGAAEREGGMTARAVRAAASADDPLARELVAETAAWLGQGVAGLVNTLNPGHVLLGGGIIDAFPELVPVVETAVRTQCQPPAAQAATVARVALDPDTVLIGAAMRAYDRLVSGPGDPAAR